MSETHDFHRYNPLLRTLPQYDTLQQLWNELKYNPLHGLDISSLAFTERLEILTGEKTAFNPTARNLDCAVTIVSMHRSSLRARNPCTSAGRLLVDERISMGLEDRDLSKVPIAPGASLLIVQGITGTAKTLTIKHTLRILGPQVVRHSAEPAALWKSATQLSWLFVPMSHDGSRGGLLNSILIQIDVVLGTSYTDDLPRKYKTVERLSGAVIALFHTLYLGVLIIDEIQLLNMVMSEHASKMHLFLLNLTNSGIPLVLSGNPLGFSWLGAYSQNMSRSVEKPSSYFHPCGSTNSEDDWDSVFEGLRWTYVLEEPPDNVEACSKLLKRRSGGIPRFAGALWCAAQRSSLLFEGRTVTAKDIEDAYLSEAFTPARALCDGFANRDSILLEKWRLADIPVDYYAEIWHPQKPAKTPNQTTNDSTPQPSLPSETVPKAKVTVPRTESSKLKAAETRKRKQDEVRVRMAQSLDPEDIRKNGLASYNLASLDQMMKSVEAGLNDAVELTPSGGRLLV